VRLGSIRVLRQAARVRAVRELISKHPGLLHEMAPLSVPGPTIGCNVPPRLVACRWSGQLFFTIVRALFVTSRV
jgi:hypothetical protein